MAATVTRLVDGVNWHRVGVIVSFVLVSIAVVVLVRMLHDVDLAAVGRAMASKDLTVLLAAAFLVAVAYLTLTLYDLFALHTIGRADVPYRTAALAGFTSYSIGHSVGFSVVSAAAVRWRIYSAEGLGAGDVAKLCFVTALTFWLGNATLLGISVAWEPEAASAVDQLPAWLNRAAAIVVLCLLAAYVAWVWRRPRVVGVGAWSLQLPGGRSTLVQIMIGVVDLTACTIAMAVLLPPMPGVEFTTILVVFVAAMLLGFASHAPGGLGVFDAAMLIALHGHFGYAKEEVLAALLVYRVLYYIVPLTLAVALLGIREVRRGMVSGRTPVPDESRTGLPCASASAITGHHPTSARETACPRARPLPDRE